MEHSNKRAVVVGIFVFLALAIFVLGVLTLGGQQSLFNKGASVSAYFDQVNGLQAGNNVWFSGVKVGTVKTIAFDKSGKVRVDMNIEREFVPVIKNDARARVGSDGFIGNKLVILSGGSPAAPLVQDGQTLAVEPALSMEDMMATLQKNNVNLLTITDNFKTLSNGMTQGRGTVGKLLQDDRLFADLQQSVATIKAAATGAQQMIADVSAYTSKFNQKGSLANDFVTDTVIFARLRNTVREIDALSDRAGNVIATLDRATQNVDAKLNDQNGTVGLLLNDRQAATDIRSAIQNLKASTIKLDENMEAMQHNFLFRGFFKRREKEKEKIK